MAAKLGHNTGGGVSINVDVHWNEVDLTNSWPLNTQEDSPWGLDRISDFNTLKYRNFDDKGFRYLYEDWVPVNIYVVDSGVRATHKEFEKHRVRWGYVAPGEKAEDLNGQGTAVASVAAGVHCGVAKHAKIVACKIGSPKLKTTVECLKWIQDEAAGLKTASVVVIPWAERDESHELDLAVRKLLEAGIHCVVAAGDANSDACYFTPARVKDCITVGGCTIRDERSATSNFGGDLDIFAPGEDVLAASNASDSDFVYVTGTSVASAHVAGLVAYFMSLLGPTTPEKMKRFIQKLAIINALYGDLCGSPNLLANNCHRMTHPVIKKDGSSK
ncbi:hypothetical protein PHLGIDRAFT_434184 [Phlebiopsis gigantea 11061_1 CR5-6]|uniref:Peptidase S8/S53 domain-containing protein n=1 Tax=Phlebiopsis gigantea (strain 11061_1 CR5-6) TaxID=745531 RepID=A0A0C3PKW4_PHLG1|nr:hypothetical protein PHLGIDRAFT_434184 [Phlebiopsis gigantea 11061_1 CR5-6]